MSTIEADTSGVVCKIPVALGDQVNDGDVVVILESMKMEIPAMAEEDGTVETIHVNEGDSVAEGDPLVTLR